MKRKCVQKENVFKKKKLIDTSYVSNIKIVVVDHVLSKNIHFNNNIFVGDVTLLNSF